MRVGIFVILGVIILTLAISAFLRVDDFALCPQDTAAPVDSPGCGPADAIIAVSGGDTNARTDHAIDLYKNGWADVLIFSGAAEDKSGPSNAEAMRLRAVNQGVPIDAIMIEETSSNTEQNAAHTKDLLEQNSIDDIILVTSAYHQRRASIEFGYATQGMDLTIRNSPSADESWRWYWWISPKGWFLALSETGKSIYLMLGGMR